MESLVCPRLLREMVAEVLFTKFGVAKLVTIPTQPAAIFAAGTTSGLVVDCGYHETVIAPVRPIAHEQNYLRVYPSVLSFRL